MFAWEIAAVLSKTSTSIVPPSKLSSKFSTLRLPFFKFVWSILIFSELLQLRGGLSLCAMHDAANSSDKIFVHQLLCLFITNTQLYTFLKFCHGIQTPTSSNSTQTLYWTMTWWKKCKIVYRKQKCERNLFMNVQMKLFPQYCKYLDESGRGQIYRGRIWQEISAIACTSCWLTEQFHSSCQISFFICIGRNHWKRIKGEVKYMG